MNVRSQSGNMLFMILIGIFLLGGLIVMLSRTSGQSEDIGSIEKSSIAASTLLKKSGALAAGVERLLNSGCSENQLNFANPIDGAYSNGSAPSDKSCDLFDEAGAGIDPVGLIGASPSVTGNYRVQGVGTAAPDLMLVTAPTRFVCEAINRSLGIVNDGPEGPPTDKLAGGAPFTGSFITPPGQDEEINIAALNGKKAGCVLNSGTNASNTALFRFYQVLIVR